MRLKPIAFLTTAILLLAGCGGQAAAPSSAPASPSASTAAPASKPAAAASTTAKPAASASPSAQSAAAKPSVAPGETLVPFTAITANMAPLWVALDNNLFPKFNVNVKTTSVTNGQVAIQALLAGDYHMVLVDGVSMTAAAVNTDTVMVAGILDRFNFSIMTKPDIANVGQLKGKKIGVTGLGNATGMAAEAMAKSQGWDPQKDIQIIQIQTLPAIVAALKTGQVDAGPLSHPTLTQARAEGMHSVQDLYKENIPFLHTGLVTTKSYLNGHRDEVTNVIKGLMAAEAYSKAHGDAFKQSITKYTKVDDPAALDETWQVYTNDLYVKKMTLTVPGEQLILDLLAPQNPGVKSIKPEQVLDSSIVDQLDKSGEIDRIYAEYGK
ncbi:MAG TPA: ABC transporter substrate-binding protein [Chloroflexota bacterium]|nr:ABC transporter substrate-binding protein [Chloroflexota bacterium]